MRLRKNDPTGSYWYMADGFSPASPVLTDAYTTFTPGLSETNGLGTRFYLPDAQGHSRGLLDNSQGNPDGYNWDAFGNSVSRFGVNPTAFAWNVSSGYQSDGDSGLKLLGHRYYDSRTGRFISQDPAGDGDNWYAYADNDPMDETDPDGLFSQGMPSTDQTMSHDLMMGFMGGFEYGGSGFGGAGSVTVTKYTHTWFDVHPNGPGWVHEPGSDTYSQEDITFSMGGSAMFAQSAATPQGAKAAEMVMEDTGVAPLGKPGNPFASYEQARNAALKWLEKYGFKAEKPYKGRFSDKPNGMSDASGKTRFRVEYDERSKAHINVESGKIKGPHFQFEGTEKMVQQIIKRFSNL